MAMLANDENVKIRELRTRSESEIVSLLEAKHEDLHKQKFTTPSGSCARRTASRACGGISRAQHRAAGEACRSEVGRITAHERADLQSCGQDPAGRGPEEQDEQDRGGRSDETLSPRQVRQVHPTTRALPRHDAQSACGVGDTVVLTETRPMSKTKRWRVTEILKKRRRSDGREEESKP